MTNEIDPLLRRCLNASIAELATAFRGVFSRETVACYLEDSVQQIGGRPAVGPNFLPVIVCDHNAGRSRSPPRSLITSPTVGRCSLGRRPPAVTAVPG